MGSKEHAEELVKRFVSFLNAQSFEAKSPDEIPAKLRGPAPPDMDSWFTWKILPSPANPWVPPLEEKLPRRFPDSFHTLISEYQFCDFEVGPVMFFANTGQLVFHELCRRIFLDKTMSPFLLNKGYLQFGKAAGGHYDPVCFAPRGLKDKTESRIVLLDHEEILLNERIKIMTEIAPSIENFMERAIQGEFEVA